MHLKEAVKHIEKHGVLLVFPLNNRKEPHSIWASFFPKSEMRWEWDDSGDSRVANLWHLREQLSRSKKVVYAKWYQGRATFFSLTLFTAMLAVYLKKSGSPRAGLGRDALSLLSALESDSPLSTRELKKAADLVGRFNESAYQRGLKQLWSRLLIVGFGEIDDGAFPSLAVGATRALFEELWEQASELPEAKAQRVIDAQMPEGSAFRKHHEKILKALTPEAAGISFKQLAGPR